VLGQHVPQFTFLNVLFGAEPALTLQESLYQRLLANDPDEATERAEEYLKDHSLAAFYDEVAIPALALVERDRARGTLDGGRRAVIADGVAVLVDNLADFEETAAPAAGKEAAPHEGAETASAPSPEHLEPAPEWQEGAVLCAGGRGNLDDAVASMLAQLLERRGIGTRLVAFEKLAPSEFWRLDLEGVRMVCLSYMNAGSLAHARYLVRRLRRRLPDTPILVGFWTFDPEEVERRDPVAAIRADTFATSLSDAVDAVMQTARRWSEPPDPATSTPAVGLKSA
jgi:hypothetical protein